MGRTDDVQEMIESHLPPYERAVHLCETYFDQVYWLFRGVTKEQLMDEMLVVVYRRPSASELEDEYGPHDLALLFIIFAIGVLVEPELPGHTSPKASSEAYAEHFHQISRAAITLQPVLEKPSIVTIQVLHLMSIYNGMSGSDVNSDTSMEMTWNLLTLAAHLSQTVGNLPPSLTGLMLIFADWTPYVCFVFSGSYFSRAWQTVTASDGDYHQRWFRDDESCFGTSLSRTCGQYAVSRPSFLF